MSSKLFRDEVVLRRSRRALGRTLPFRPPGMLWAAALIVFLCAAAAAGWFVMPRTVRYEVQISGGQVGCVRSTHLACIGIRAADFPRELRGVAVLMAPRSLKDLRCRLKGRFVRPGMLLRDNLETGRAPIAMIAAPRKAAASFNQCRSDARGQLVVRLLGVE